MRGGEAGHSSGTVTTMAEAGETEINFYPRGDPGVSRFDRAACVLTLPNAALCAKETRGAHVLILKNGEPFPVHSNIVARLRGADRRGTLRTITVAPDARRQSAFGLFAASLCNFATRVCKILDGADDPDYLTRTERKGDPPGRRVGFGTDPRTIVFVARKSEAQKVAHKLEAALRAFAAAVQDEAGQYLGGHTPDYGVKVATFDSPSEVTHPCERVFSMTTVRHDALNYTSIALNFAPALSFVLFSELPVRNNIIAERGDGREARLAVQRWALTEFILSLGYNVHPLVRESRDFTRTDGWDGAHAMVSPLAVVHFADAPAVERAFANVTTVTVLPNFEEKTGKSRKRNDEASEAGAAA